MALAPLHKSPKLRALHRRCSTCMRGVPAVSQRQGRRCHRQGVRGPLRALVLRAGGHNIKRIQEATGARVQVEQRRPMGGCPSTVVISGTKEAVGKAFEIVQDHLSKTNTPPARGPSVLVPSAPGSAMAAPSPSSRIVGQVSPYGLSGDRSSINSYGVPGYSQPPYYGRLPSPQFAEVPASPAGAYYGAQPRALPPGWLSGTGMPYPELTSRCYCTGSLLSESMCRA
eukprot:scaffold1653_cov389-Prasinococcus_capsulatus_cf.AAC.12